MKHLTYHYNRWSCLPTALAMVVDYPVVKLVIDYFGHDGSEIVWRDQPEPFNRRGFQPNEMVMVAYCFGVKLIPIIPTWPALSKDGGEPRDIKLDSTWVNKMFSVHDGVLIGSNSHAVAWDHQEKIVLDPNGTKYPLEMFPLESFWCKVN